MKTLRNTLAGLALLMASLAFAGPSAAQTRDELGLRLAHELISAVNMSELVRENAMKSAGSLDAFDKVRPEWKPLILEAMNEAFDKDQPAMEATFGRAFARTFSMEELSAAMAIFGDPQARIALAAASRHQTVQTGNGPPCAPACMKAMSSPAGRSFMSKLSSVLTPALQGDMVATVIPDFFIIAGEKLKAAEAKRTNP